MIDAALLSRWTVESAAGLERRCAEIDDINVFPVADGDTGTNMLLTMRAAGDELRRRYREDSGPLAPGSPGCAEAAAALARGALVGARGNSGVILSQVLRGFAEAIGEAQGAVDAGVLRAALGRAHRLARAAVARPREGTVLSVLSAAASAAASDGSDLPADVAASAASAAAEALRATTSQLPELARAGVVDAGGYGLLVVLDALVTALGRPAEQAPSPPPPPRTRTARGAEALTTDRESGSDRFSYEVMFLLDGTDDARVTALRAELGAVGDSVAVVGDGAPGGTGLWNVHVHCNDVGAAVEAGIEAGRPHRVTVMRFADQAGAAAGDTRFTRDRAVLMVVAAPEVAELARESGADVVDAADSAPHADDLAAALAGTRARHVVLLPGDPDLTGHAERAASAARRSGQEVVVIPTSSVLQGLSALAVHDVARRPGDDVVAMAEAAAGTRTAGLLVAESEALTWVGRCSPGDVLGISDGEVVLIAPDLSVGALWLAHRMLTAGGELVTALLGAEADVELGEHLAEDLRRTHPEVDVVVYRGGQIDFPLVLGVE
ncbi:dihydroxyacetone kinase [Pseudonocardia sulfidoxydans NBRC 16205]|uniref:Dihydroxyacetone kinase n=1 Tax=Pseudonocardia sulfidoxydans NBRC 16205 TaxID=1223511 RepID=A0A511DNG1_9PSEU|nr:DAK2 domain-containing protein [Pseudonocardia sulfidoxydans]GEL26325.1 dihydroxyacetone kinase [Pseudonocardia sulfidoxydans NBRC 16205]